MFLKGKTAIVTGSTSGIGLAYARAFAGGGRGVVSTASATPTRSSGRAPSWRRRAARWRCTMPPT